MNTKPITKEAIRYSGANLEIGNGLIIRVKTEHDQTHGAPWEECDGHGIVSEWTSRDKRAGEKILSTDRRMHRFYDVAETMKIAKRDGWGTSATAAPYDSGTKGERAARAVTEDFEFLRGWCADEWQYVGVLVSLHDADDKEIAADSVWGVESFGDYWKEQAAEIANQLIENHAKETGERAFWEARDVETISK